MLRMIKSWWIALENRTFDQRVKLTYLTSTFLICGASSLLIKYGLIVSANAQLLTLFIILLSGILFVSAILAIAGLYLIKYIEPKVKELLDK